MNVTVGIDLAGVETRPTGFCILDGTNAYTCLLYSNREKWGPLQAMRHGTEEDGD